MGRRRRQPQDIGSEPSFEDFQTAFRVIVWTRRWLEQTGGLPTGERGRIANCPVFSQITLRQSQLLDPARFDGLLSAEGHYESGEHSTKQAMQRRAARAAHVE